MVTISKKDMGTSSSTAPSGGGAGRPLLRTCLDALCGCQIDSSEYLEVEQVCHAANKDPWHAGNGGGGGGGGMGIPRIRSPGEHYIDTHNDEPWTFSLGTGEENGIWMNSGDQAGSIMATLVWLLMTYSAVTVTLLTITKGFPPILGMIYALLCAMALACHAKTSLTDPGSVPRAAVPQEEQRRENPSHSMCGQCQTFKPPMSHHCRICNRCVSRMDHHCPWVSDTIFFVSFCEFLSSSCRPVCRAWGLLSIYFAFSPNDVICLFVPNFRRCRVVWVVVVGGR